MRIEWTQPALADLIEIETYIGQESPEAAQLIGQRIWDASQGLMQQPKKGREGHVDGTREWVIDKTPCLLVCRLQKAHIENVYVHHDSQNWKA